MRRLIIPAIAFAALCLGSNANAQIPEGAPVYSFAPAGWPTYSYYATPVGYPARVYVGLGTPVDFPYHGQIYGHAYDRFTWGALSTGSDPRLVRYYAPPLR